MTREFLGLRQFAEFAAERAQLATPYLVEAVGVTGRVLYNRALDTFGDKGLLQPPLAQATQDRRAKQGYSPDNPLLASGKLRNDLEYMHEGLVTGIGSPNPVMQYQELGTSHIPPRPLLKITVASAHDENWLVIRHYASKIIGINVEGGGTMPAVLGGANIVNQFTGKLKKG